MILFQKAVLLTFPLGMSFTKTLIRNEVFSHWHNSGIDKTMKMLAHDKEFTFIWTDYSSLSFFLAITDINYSV